MPARAMWSGSVTVGLMTLPVKLYTATDEGKSVGFSMICREHNAPVRMPRVCSEGDEKLAADQIVKGYQAGDTLVILDDADLANLPLSTTKELRLDAFVPMASVLDPLLVKSVYNVGPDKVGKKAFAMLRDALHQSQRAGVGKVALRGGREQLAALCSDGANLRLVLLHWADDVRDASEIAAQADEDVSEAEVAMGVALIETLAADFDLTAHHDDYAAAVMSVIDAKLAGTEAPKPAAPKANTGNDLMAALAASLAAAKQSKENVA